jgi:molybdopterin synthase sulfur carrier subunit
MPQVFIPALMRSLAGGAAQVEVSGATVRQIVNELEARYPGLRDRLCDGDELRPGIAVAVDGRVSSRGLLQKVEPASEVHFLPAIGGG